jgi:hypothetical protein
MGRLDGGAMFPASKEGDFVAGRTMVIDGGAVAH